MKIQAQPGLPPMPSILWIATARKPLKAPAIVEDVKKTATRVPSSVRLYQLLGYQYAARGCGERDY